MSQSFDRSCFASPDPPDHTNPCLFTLLLHLLLVNPKHSIVMLAFKLTPLFIHDIRE